MTVLSVVEDRIDILCQPSVLRPLFTHDGTVVARKCIGLTKPSSLGSFRGQGVDDVAHHGVPKARALVDGGWRDLVPRHGSVG